uniref:Myb/SANT-like DNA-binding domain-containing protein 4 n=1 Tax=Salarias fasciatus TaxID=181472 RepID=A0A672FJD8_SALFA
VKHLKRKRKSNYSVRETQALIQEIQKRRDVLFSRQQNTAINELKRQAWEEVAQGVNALGEGELRTAAEVKRRYLDWRSLMKKKQLQAELLLSSLAMKTEYNPSSPEHEAAPLGSAPDQLLDLSAFPKDYHCDWPELVALSEPGGPTGVGLPGVKMENEVRRIQYGEMDEDDIPSLLSDIESRGEGQAGDVYSHNDLGMLGSSKDPTSTTRLGDHGILVAMERQRLEVETQRLAVETERLAVEKERLSVEKERLRQVDVQREQLQLERERLQVERERLRLLMVSQSEHVDSSFDLPPQQGAGWMLAVDLNAEKLNLERERLQLEKERLQFFKFEAGRLQIERERLQVEKERMQLHSDH